MGSDTALAPSHWRPTSHPWFGPPRSTGTSAQAANGQRVPVQAATFAEATPAQRVDRSRSCGIRTGALAGEWRTAWGYGNRVPVGRDRLVVLLMANEGCIGADVHLRGELRGASNACTTNESHGPTRACALRLGVPHASCCWSTWSGLGFAPMRPDAVNELRTAPGRAGHHRPRVPDHQLPGRRKMAEAEPIIRAALLTATLDEEDRDAFGAHDGVVVRSSGRAMVGTMTVWCAPCRGHPRTRQGAAGRGAGVHRVAGFGRAGAGNGGWDQPAGPKVSSRPRVRTLISGQPRRPGSAPVGSTTPAWRCRCRRWRSARIAR